MHLSTIRARARTAAVSLAFVLAATLAQTGPALDASAAGEDLRPVASRASSGSTLFGGTAFERSGETFREAVGRVRETYGGSVDVLRMFFPGLPSPWSRIRENVGRTPLVVSFRADTDDVLAGRHDAYLREWFADAPTKRRTFWTYWHEPENDRVDLGEYRRAWRHLARLADQADNRRLRSTLILMCWTLDPRSGREFRDYFAGKGSIDVLGFDCYNTDPDDYHSPARIVAPAARKARALGMPFGIAEFGSTVLPQDGGTRGRAEWLRDYGRAVRKRGGVFATYFDSYVGHDYRLHDAPSRRAWRRVVQGD